MIPALSARLSGFVPRAIWVGAAAALALSFLFGSFDAAAAPPTANTIIGNQASATYLDPNGASQLATSNLVQTTVQQVGSFAIDNIGTPSTTVVNTKTGAAGTTVYAPHVLTNTGNGTDTFALRVAAPPSPNGFTKVEVFPDANADGVPDSTTPLCSAVPSAACELPAQTVVGGGSFPFVVAYSIPSTATATTFTSPVASTITATAGTPGLYAHPQVSDVDNVNLTDQAAFNATKSLSVPAVSWVGGANWPTASSSGVRSAAGCAATVAAASAPAVGCSYTTYTLKFNNTGGAAGTFVMTDTLPSGFTYVAGSAVWSNAPGAALTDTAGGDAAGIDFKADQAAGKLAFVVTGLQSNATQTVSFVVLVNSNAVVGTSTTTNTAKYSPTAPTGTPPTSDNPGAPGASTNPSSYTVLGSFGIVVGSATPDVTQSKDATPGTPNANAQDLTTVAAAGASATAKFSQTVFNTGSAADTVNLSAAAAATGGFPAGTIFRFLAADGLTLLIDTNGDGIVDTGPIDPGSNVKIVLAVTLPANAAPGTAGYSAVVTGKSTGNSTKLDATLDTLSAIRDVLVDLTNSANSTGNDAGAGPSQAPTSTNTTAAGTGTIFTLFVKNNDTVPNTYSLAASQTNSFPGNLPAGWTVKFVAANAGCAGTAVTDTGSVASGAQTHIDACVTPPDSQAPVTAQSIYFQVRSTRVTSSGVTAIDTKLDAVTVTSASRLGAILTPNNNGQVAPGGSVVYPHTLTNTGTQSCTGPYTFAATLPDADKTAGWSTALYIDNDGDGQIGANDSLVGTDGQIGTALAAGASQKLLVKVFAPGGATAGGSDAVTVAVTFPAGSCGKPSVTDTTTVVTGQMRLVKTQALDTSCGTTIPAASAFSSVVLTAKPGECIVYRVVATNQGVAPVTNMSINDAVPAYTRLMSPQPGSDAERCASIGVSNTAPVYSATPTAVACGSASNTVAPGGTATLTFSVKVND